MDFNKIKRVCILDICDIARTKKGIRYSLGTVYLQVSATHGAIEILKEDTELEAGKYVVFTPKIQIDSEYLKIILEMEMPEFMSRYMTGINIQTDNLKYLFVMLHEDIEIQIFIVNQLKELDKTIQNEESIVNDIKDVKCYMLAKMFI